VTEVAPEGANVSWTEEKQVHPKNLGEANVRLSWSRTIGLWIAAFFTLSIFSFLYGDNFFYKLAESIFIGSSAGYAMVVGFWGGAVDLLFRDLMPDFMRATVYPTLAEDATSNLVLLIPLAMGIMFLWRLAPVGGWISRWPLAFFIGITVGLRLIVYFESDFISQIQSTMIPLVVFASDGAFDFWASMKNITIVIGVLSCLVYFFFSIEHKGVVGGTARLGIWMLMVTFGAGFGYTVMGRIALLSGRLEFLFDDWLWIIDPIGKRLIE